MADTVIGTGDPQARKIWSRMMTREAIGRTFLRRFMGTSPNSIMQLHRDMNRERGDEVKYDLLMQLSGYGVTGDTALKGAEEALVYHQDSLTIDQSRQGVIYGSMSQQRTIHDIRMDAMNNLADWHSRVMDESMLALLAGTAGANASLATHLGTFAGTTLSEVDAAHIVNKIGSTFTVDFLTVCRETAKTGGTAGDPIIRPIRTQAGEDVFAIVLHPYQVTSMKVEAGSNKWREIVANARERSGTNPIFTGALGMWDGVVIHESIYVPRGTGDYAGLTPTANTNWAVFLGAQSGHLGFGNPYSRLGRNKDRGSVQEMFTFFEDVDDYNERTGVAASSIYGMKRAIYDSKTYGMLLLPTDDAPSGP